MRLVKPFTLACIGSMVIAMMLTIFSQGVIKSRGVPESLPVISELSPLTINENNLVDALSELPLTLRYSKVSWNASTLAIDVHVKKMQHTSESIYENMAKLILFSFAQTTNVNQLFLRFVEEDEAVGRGKSLLLALDVRRDELREEELQILRSLQGEPDSVLKERLHLRYTTLWRNEFKS
ncbi:hypothetical protein BVG16_03775 [Paenibacillus selenitireducens]|uniref:DUF4825 domain-containing protein n=1 Tax=Paenibacillus selenitireducens TaxID=1324314 RepID=A0A1T2XNP0_9BACL|nr:hypothetical protein [Paenibacillus selenitireducens]OPA81438.1 hypothetical protein BVG16_03775 [Paenibacillus selenitireducens]